MKPGSHCRQIRIVTEETHVYGFLARTKRLSKKLCPGRRVRPRGENLKQRKKGGFLGSGRLLKAEKRRKSKIAKTVTRGLKTNDSAGYVPRRFHFDEPGSWRNLPKNDIYHRDISGADQQEPRGFIGNSRRSRRGKIVTLVGNASLWEGWGGKRGYGRDPKKVSPGGN